MTDLSLQAWLRREIRTVLRQRFLAEADALRGVPHDAESSDVLPSPERVPLQLSTDSTAIWYRCAITLALARGAPERSRPLATALAGTLAARLHPLGMGCRMEDPGWLDCYLGDRALARWLQRALDAGPPADASSHGSATAGTFALQYAHARCRSLLQLGHRQGTIRLGAAGQWLAPQPVPWRSAGALQLCHPSERAAIAAAIATADGEAGARPDWARCGRQLGEALLALHRDCRIWGNVAQQQPQLAQARLGLVAIGRSLLARLLQRGLGTGTLPGL